MRAQTAILLLAALLGYAHTTVHAQKRIVGGQPAIIGDHKYVVQVRDRGRPICGGTLVSSYHVVTAAHCVDYSNARDISIKAGATFLNGVGGQLRDVSRIYIHWHYDFSTLDNDMAILQLTCRLQGRLIQPINLMRSPVPENGRVTVLGWGLMSEGGMRSEELLKVTVPMVSHEVCQNAYEGNILDSMICAGEAGKDACQGDSGGPLVFNDRLAGVVSWGYGCARAEYPGVFADVHKLMQFIDMHIH